MSDGATHHEYWKKGLKPVAIVCAIGFATGLFYAQGYPAEFFFWFFVHYLSGRYIDPDLDLEGVTSSEGRMSRELDFFGLLWRWWWMLYALLIGYAVKRLKLKGMYGGHRSVLSHSLVPGTVIRMIFVNLPFQIVINLVNTMLHKNGLGMIQFAILDLVIYYSAQFLGLGMADIIHLNLDDKTE